MTADEVREAAAELVRRTTAAQGLPEHIEDPATIAKIAVILRDGRPSADRRTS